MHLLERGRRVATSYICILLSLFTAHRVSVVDSQIKSEWCLGLMKRSDAGPVQREDVINITEVL